MYHWLRYVGRKTSGYGSGINAPGTSDRMSSLYWKIESHDDTLITEQESTALELSLTKLAII